jgi:DNA-binding beta-propeller fold protein YncE
MVSLAFISGTGDIGEIGADWTVSESATPISPADTSGSVGGVDLSAAHGTDSEFVIDNGTTFTHDRLGDISGKVDTVDSDGESEDLDTSVSLSLTTPLTRLNVNRVMPPMGYVTEEAPGAFGPYGTTAGTLRNVYAIATSPIDGSVYVTQRPDVLGGGSITKYDKDGVYQLRFGTGTGIGNGNFDATYGPGGIAVSPVDGAVWVDDSGNSRIQKFNSSGVYVTKTGTAGSANGEFGTAGLPIPLAVDASGNVFAGDRGNGRVQKFNSSGTYQAKVSVPGGNTTPFDVDVGGPSDEVYVTVNGLNIPGGSSDGPSIKVFSNSLVAARTIPYLPGAAGGDGVYYGYMNLSVLADGRIWVSSYVDNFLTLIDGTTGEEFERLYSGYTASVQLNDGYSPSYSTFNDVLYVGARGFDSGADPNPTFGTNNRVQSYSYAARTLSAALQAYVDQVDPTIVIDYNAADDPIVVVPGWSGNVWKHLKDAASAYHVEIGVVDDTVTVRDVGSVLLDTANIEADSARLSLNSTATGLSINIKNYNAEVGSGIVYDADSTGKIFQINSGQTVTETISGTNFPTQLNTPTQTATSPVSAGQYMVVGSDNLVVSTTNWLNAGGSITVAINDAIPGGIDVTIIGPGGAIGGISTFYIGRYDGTSIVPAFSITGGGVFSTPVVLNILSGADETKTSELVAVDIDNVFIDTPGRAYDAGAWALFDASGPAITLKMNIPTSVVGGFGLAQGSTFILKENRYRVVDAEISEDWTQITCTPYVTTAEVDALWTSLTTGDWDTFWGSSDTLDFKIKPLRV